MTRINFYLLLYDQLVTSLHFTHINECLGHALLQGDRVHGIGGTGVARSCICGSWTIHLVQILGGKAYLTLNSKWCNRKSVAKMFLQVQPSAKNLKSTN